MLGACAAAHINCSWIGAPYIVSSFAVVALSLACCVRVHSHSAPDHTRRSGSRAEKGGAAAVHARPVRWCWFCRAFCGWCGWCAAAVGVPNTAAARQLTSEGTAPHICEYNVINLCTGRVLLWCIASLRQPISTCVCAELEPCTRTKPKVCWCTMHLVCACAAP